MPELTFLNDPRISLDIWRQTLVRSGSPAAASAADLYAIVADYGLDPAIALAFFAHESTYGLYGVARRSLNWGNLRRGPRAYAAHGGFAFYHSWAESLRDWCELIATRYVARGLATVEAAIPVYAPSSDGNAPVCYTAFVRRQVATWMAASALNDSGIVSLVVAVPVANVRSAPEIRDNVVEQKYQGAPVAGVWVDGELVAVSRRWLRIAPNRYMHASVLR